MDKLMDPAWRQHTMVSKYGDISEPPSEGEVVTAEFVAWINSCQPSPWESSTMVPMSAVKQIRDKGFVVTVSRDANMTKYLYYVTSST